MASTIDNAGKRVAVGAIAVRFAVATLGAYAVAYVLTAALAVGLFRLSVAREDATMLATVTALLVFPTVSIWAFAERRLWVVVLGPALAVAALALAAYLLRP